MAGFVLLLAGLFRAGSLIAYVPEAVIHGFTLGIAVIIATSQLKDFFGLSIAELPAGFIEKVTSLWMARETAAFGATAIGVLTIILIVGFRRVAPRWPGLIVAIATTSALVAWFELPVDTIATRYGDLPRQLPLPSVPSITFGQLIELLPSALVIAFLAGVESLLSAMVADRMIGGHHRSNAELIAQGGANIGSALFGGLPATGAIARTATNVQAGGKTPVAGIIHAITVLAIMMTAAPLAGSMAMPALAALLIVTAWNMSEPHKWASYFSARPSDKFLLLLTLILTVVADLTVAIGVGVAFGLAIRLHRRDVPPADWSPPER